MFECMFDTPSKHPPTDTVKVASEARLCALVRPRGGVLRMKPHSEERYSHSMVPGGLLVTSSTTRFTSGTSLVMRVEMRSSTS